MKVTLRQRNQGGKTSLYLDYYNKGKRKTEYLNLYLEPNPKTKEQKEINKKTQQLAETIRAQRQIEIQNGTYGFRDSEKLKGSFTAYLQLLANKRKDSAGNYGNWDSMIKHFKKFMPQDISFEFVNREFVQDFKEYLDKKAIAHGVQKLSQKFKVLLFQQVSGCLKTSCEGWHHTA